MAIYDNTWSTGEKILSAKLQNMYLNEVNSTDDIHPQYRAYYSASGFVCGYQNLTGSLFIYTQHGGGTLGGADAIDVIEHSYPPISVKGYKHSFQKLQAETVALKFDYVKNNTNNNFLVAHSLYVNGAIVGSATNLTPTTSPQTESVSIDISSYNSTDIIEINILVAATTGNLPSGYNNCDYGKFYNLSIVLS
jgi:hypothetical protein